MPKILSTLMIALGLSCASMYAQEKMVAVSEDEWLKVVKSRTQPAYPPIARQMKIEGQVLLDLSVDPGGKLTDVKVASGNPVLSSAAVSAIKNWKFDPYEINGKAVGVSTRVHFNFQIR